MVQSDQWNEVGNVNVYMDANSTGQDGVLVLDPINAPSGDGPDLQFQIDVYNTSNIVENASGDPNEQSASFQEE